ncbi:MAG: helix-hairpin-helix domain-containing protein [Chlorobiales bacterium]|nr:helix-hairpin-helix domain-containing protein [Chlorobiales bacterium]
MNLRDKIAVILGMTRAEIIVVSSLLLFFVLGIIINNSRLFQKASLFIEKEQVEHFTDTEVDSLLREAALLETALAQQGKQASHIRLLQNPTTTGTGNTRKIVFSNATVEELSSIPGISDILASRLIVFRKSRQGKVERFQDFLEVKGIGSKRVETLKQHLTLD